MEEIYIEPNEKIRKEAEKYNIQIIGEGKNGNFRLYKLPCGHIEEKTKLSIRKGTFKCTQCHEEEIKKIGLLKNLKYIGYPENKDKHYRRYECLKCGHKQDYRVDSVRNSDSVLCEECFKKQCIDDAKNNGLGLEYIGESDKGVSYRKYRILKCGHFADYVPSNLKGINNVRCDICQNEKLTQEALMQGYELIGDSKKGKTYRLYKRIECGHVDDYKTGHMRIGNVKCSHCINESHVNKALINGFILLGKSDKGNAYRRYKKISCGHIDDILIHVINKSNGFCKQCWLEEKKQQAIAIGIEFVRTCDDEDGSNKGVYKLPCCKKEQNILYHQIKNNSFECKYCDGYHLNNGLKVKSRYEWLVGNYLLDENIDFEYDKRLGKKTCHRTDYYIKDKDLYIEVAGGYDCGGIFKDYADKLKIKHNLYYKDKNILYIYPNDFKNEIWEIKLKEVI